MRELRGRGVTSNPANRFERLWVEVAQEHRDGVPTVYLRDRSRSLISRNDSPDIPFEASINPYRGCEHGCSYCYARPTHEYLGMSAGLDFETRILVKTHAPALLRRELSSPRWRPQVIAMSGVTDPYQPAERELRVTRGCLAVLAELRNPVAIITKSDLVTRDLDLLAELAGHRAAAVSISLTTLDAGLARAMEPRAAAPHRRLEAIRALAAARVPCGVMVAPVVPGLTEHEMPAILQAAAAAGAGSAGYVMLRLPHGVAGLFDGWLEAHFPDRRSKVLRRIRSMRSERLDDPRFGSRMRGAGPHADHVADLFARYTRRVGLSRRSLRLSTDAFRRPGQATLPLGPA